MAFMSWVIDGFKLASAAAQALMPISRIVQAEDMAMNVNLLQKLSPVFARSLRERKLVSADGTLDARDLCIAQQLARNITDLYK